MVYAIVGAVIIGLSLGLLGSGGSILTVPVLVYLLHHPSKAAIAESLAIVGGIALLGTIPYAMSRRVDWRNVGFFGVPGMAGTVLGAYLAKYVPGAVQLVLFSVVMLLAAWMMFRPPGSKHGAKEEGAKRARWKIALDGLGVGVLTGLVGVGGGFLIVPALVLLGGLRMQVAVGTSLAIIALKSISGFVKYLDVLDDLEMEVDWPIIGLFIAVGFAGSLAGHAIGTRVNQDALKKAFAVFLVVMGTFILIREVPKAIGGLAEESKPAGQNESLRSEEVPDGDDDADAESP